MKKLLIIDSNSIINRAFYGVRYLSTKSGVQTNAVYGFLNILIKLINEQKPDYICAAFDLKEPTFRHKMYDQYKAQRKPMPDGLREQMPIAKDVISKMGITILEKAGYEADDIIGTVSRICEENGTACFIATGDKDDLQLATDKTKVILTVTKQGYNETVVYDDKEVFDKYGVTPSEFIDVKALMGDVSDNIPGVKGIGEKTAVKLISEYKSIEYIYDNINSIKASPSVLKKLEEGKESAFLSKTLATIDTHSPVDFDMENCVFDGIKDCGGLYELLSELELNRLIRQLNLSGSKSDEETEDNKSFFDALKIVEPDKREGIKISSGEVSFICEFSGDKLINAVIYSDNTAYLTDALKGWTDEEIVSVIKPILENESIAKIVFNIKDTIVKLNGRISIKNICDDTAIALYLIDPSVNEFSIPRIAMDYLNVEISHNEKQQISMFDDEDNDIEFYARRTAVLPCLRDKFAEKIKENEQEYLYREIELPLIEVLADMQINGFTVDGEELQRFSKMLSERIEEETQLIYDMAGEEFNINSPKQLGVILFEKLGLRVIKKTKSGYSTNVEVLERLRDDHPIIGLIMDYRHLTKLKSTYCDSLYNVINPKTGRIHSVFNQTVTLTGRISSTEPNMQNIPVRTELGREIRKMFTAKEGCVLVDADYSQIELRVLAHIADDENMIKAFISGEDIHAVTASQVLGIPLEEVTKEQRSNAKAVNFGIVYGIGEFSLSKDLNISVKEARAYIAGYLKKYSGVKQYMENIKAKAKEDGYVKTLLNRIRYIPELKSSNFNVRSFGERIALNTPIQGTAADIIKLAMVKVSKRLKQEGLKSKLILQVHDELIIEAEKDEAEKVRKILREEMEGAMKLKVPLVIDMAEGHSWYDTK